MKLPKPLLAAMLAGIILQTAQSCTKEKDDEPKKEEKEKEGEKPKPPFPLYNCPACGMG